MNNGEKNMILINTRSKEEEQQLKLQQITDIDKGWIAGILDGESCFIIKKNHIYGQPFLQVGQKVPEIPEKLLELTGLGRVSY